MKKTLAILLLLLLVVGCGAEEKSDDPEQVAIAALEKLGATLTDILSSDGQYTSPEGWVSSVDLSGTDITDTDLVHLKQLPADHLFKVNLSSTRITDAGLEHLMELSPNVEFTLYKTKLSDGALDRLQERNHYPILCEYLDAKAEKSRIEAEQARIRWKKEREAALAKKRREAAEAVAKKSRVEAEAATKTRDGISLQRLAVFGDEYVGKKVRFSNVKFSGIVQSGVSAFPMIQIKTDGLITIYRKNEAEKWVNFAFIGKESNFCNYTLASKELWAEFLLGLKRNDNINVEGVVVDLPSSTDYGIIVTHIEKVD